MIYVETNSKSSFFNFAVEDYIMKEKNLGDDVFMFWRTTPTLMVGKFQNIASEINMAYAKEKNITIVRRRSGGGTIYTDEGGWQFSYFLPGAKHSDVDFQKNASAVVKALNEIGVEAYFNDRNDVYIENRKICGNARFVNDFGILHHGSLLYDSNIEEMVRSITVSDDKIISKGIKSIKQRVANISEYLSEKLSPEDFKKLMLKHILGDDYKEYVLTEQDLKRINEIRNQTFESWEWTWGKNPKFEISKNRRFDGGKVEISYKVENGIIQNISFCGDFFFDGSIEELESALCGAKLEKYELCRIIDEKNRFFKVPSDELADLILL